MANVNFRLELSSAQVKQLVDLLVADLVEHGPQNGRRYRTGLDVVIYEDETRKGQRNGHAIRVHVEGQSAGLFATATDVVLDPQ